MDEGSPGASAGRPLSRREIDEVVRDALRLESDLDRLGPETLEALLERTAYHPAARPGRSSRPTGERRRRPERVRLVAMLLTGVVIVGLFVLAHRTAAPEPLPHHPTTYADGHYAFLKVQPGNPDQPVGYNPCKRLPVAINYLDATPDIREVLADALVEVNWATGMHLEYAGASMKRRRDEGSTGTILVSFDDTSSDEALKGAAAVGGSLSYRDGVPGSTQYYVGGEVTLNTDAFNRYPRATQVAILLHELGHALGLAHSPGGTEVMNPDGGGVDHFQHGDLTALATLGRLPCR